MTTTADPRAMRYLLGEMTETEMTAFEREYMSSPDLFARLVQSETALADDYVRQRMPTQVRQRFEEHYLSHPKRRERVTFASALARKVDEHASRPAGVTPTGSWWAAIARFGSGPVPGMTLAAAVVILLLSTAWLMFQTSRLRGDLARSERTRALEQQKVTDLQGQLSSARDQTRTLTAELERMNASRTAQPDSSATANAPLVSLLLTVPTARTPATGELPTAVIPAAARELHIQLAMDETEHASYQVSLSVVASPPVFTQSHLTPRKTGAGARLDVRVPAERLAAGDYMLTLNGELPRGGTEAVSQILFRVTR